MVAALGLDWDQSHGGNLQQSEQQKCEAPEPVFWVPKGFLLDVVVAASLAEKNGIPSVMKELSGWGSSKGENVATTKTLQLWSRTAKEGLSFRDC
ncbi:hypothetical protein AV530_005651 [Patagioenas fasciata monilis]|uniref:Uncharacterized protein n=1 Tax=Patagioenas fasciata monilis TaxID=372326 RepID=A0A1V4JM33_PATFA|nr:hypothetical protein AV530_005651 [Patagioenas fasciata monilis]